MAMYRWQVTHASLQLYFASRFHYDNNNDNSNNNKIGAAAESKRQKIFDEFTFRNVPFSFLPKTRLGAILFMDLFDHFLFFFPLLDRRGVAISKFVRGCTHLHLSVSTP